MDLLDLGLKSNLKTCFFRLPSSCPPLATNGQHAVFNLQPPGRNPHHLIRMSPLHVAQLRISLVVVERTTYSFWAKVLGGIPDVSLPFSAFSKQVSCFPTPGHLSSPELCSTISSPLERIHFHFSFDVFWESYISIFGLTSMMNGEKILTIFVPTNLSWKREELSRFILSIAELAEKCLGCLVLRIFPSDGGSFTSSTFKNDLEFVGFVSSTSTQALNFYFLRFA